MPTTTKDRAVPTVAEQPMMVGRDTFAPLGLSTTTGYALLKRGEFPIPAQRVGGRWLVRTADLRRFLGVDQPTDRVAS